LIAIAPRELEDVVSVHRHTISQAKHVATFFSTWNFCGRKPIINKNFMKRFLKWFFIFLFCIAIILAAMIGYAWEAAFGPGLTKEKTAQILVNDDKFGGRAEQKAIRYGDSILPLIKNDSANFEKLNGRNSFWIAEVLGKIRTDKSRSILLDLYSRPNHIAKLTGAIGLLEQGVFPEKITTDSILVQTVKNQSVKTETEAELAIIALGYSKDTNALPCLMDLLKNQPSSYWLHADACDAVARIGSQEAVPVLEDCLRSQQFYALPNAFRALIALGDKQAVPLAIDRVSPDIKMQNSGFVLGELKKVTGKSFGDDRDAWRNWWDSVKTTWEIPGDYLKPWDEQKPVY
jgi:hypothetical protein